MPRTAEYWSTMYETLVRRATICLRQGTGKILPRRYNKMKKGDPRQYRVLECQFTLKLLKRARYAWSQLERMNALSDSDRVRIVMAMHGEGNGGPIIDRTMASLQQRMRFYATYEVHSDGRRVKPRIDD
jgi:hypothetical protein